VPQRLFAGILDAGQAATSSFFDNVDDEVDLSADPILQQVRRNKEAGAGGLPGGHPLSPSALRALHSPAARWSGPGGPSFPLHSYP
jgi:hypothetical protein